MTADPAPAVRALLLDIEGTTTPISFVVDVLFPYARRALRRHLERHASEPDYKSIFGMLTEEHAADRQRGEAVPPWTGSGPHAHLDSVASYVEWLMDRDRKSTALKALQGKIWKEGYRTGELSGEVFDEVPEAFAGWRARGLGIGIFSSGSVLAQQLLFRHSSAGDLTRFVQWYFDTMTGAKHEAGSYGRIAAAMGVPAEAIVFVSDVTRELDAARAAGMQTVLSMRPGNAPPPLDHGHPAVSDLRRVTAALGVV